MGRHKKAHVSAEWNDAVERLADHFCQAVEPVYDAKMQPFSLFSDRLKLGLHSALDEFHTRFTHGWDLLVHGLSAEKKKLNFKVATDHYFDNKTGKPKTKRLGTQTLATKLGLSDEMVLTFYETAKHLLEEKKDTNAADAFFCLSMLCPQVSALWLGMARAEQSGHHLKTALAAYQMALILDRTDPDLYVEAARCCVEMHDYETGLEILDAAQSFANSHPHTKNRALLRECAASGKEEIKKMQTIAR